MAIKNIFCFSALIVIISAALPLLSSESNAGGTYFLNPENLASTIWKTAPDDAGDTMEITFNRDGHFEFQIDLVQSYIDAKGTYSINDGKLKLVIDDSNMGKRNIGMSLQKGVILTDKNSPKFRRYLYFQTIKLEEFYMHVNELVLWDTSSIVKMGESVSIQGIDSITMGVKEGVVTNVLKIRETPDPKGKEILITSVDSDDNAPAVVIKALPKGQRLFVLARTKEKSTVGKSNNYWYYVEFELNGTRKAWVYGEFVNIK